jgi:hypothetical protein
MSKKRSKPNYPRLSAALKAETAIELERGQVVLLRIDRDGLGPCLVKGRQRLAQQAPTDATTLPVRMGR